MTQGWHEVPCDSEPHGEDATVQANADRLIDDAMFGGQAWSRDGKRVDPAGAAGGVSACPVPLGRGEYWPLRSQEIATPLDPAQEQRIRGLIDAGHLRTADGEPWHTGAAMPSSATESAVREFCEAFGIPVPADMKRAVRALERVGLIGDRRL